jgi:hypothetical protein
VPDEKVGLRFFASAGREEMARLREIHAAGNACLEAVKVETMSRLSQGRTGGIRAAIDLLGVVIRTGEAMSVLADVFVVLDRRCESEGGDAAALTSHRMRLKAMSDHGDGHTTSPSPVEAYWLLRQYCLRALAGHPDQEVRRIALSRLLRAEPERQARIDWYMYLYSAYQKDHDTIETLRALLASDGSPLAGDELGKRVLKAMEKGEPVDLDP